MSDPIKRALCLVKRLRSSAMPDQYGSPGESVLTDADLIEADLLESDPLDIEALAELEHNSWSRWMQYLHPRIVEELLERLGFLYGGDNAQKIVSAFLHLGSVKRYLRQMGTSYADLPEKEKESDRVEVRKKLSVYRPRGKG